MKYNLRNLRNFYAKTPKNSIYSRVTKDCIDAWIDGDKKYLDTVYKYGANTGIANNLVYPQDFINFYNQYREDIREIAIRLMDDYEKPLVGSKGIFTELNYHDMIKKNDCYKIRMAIVAYDEAVVDIYFNIFGGEING